MVFADGGVTVHALGKEFTVPGNCEFYARPAVTGGEVRFNCTYLSPPDSVTVHFRSKQYCEKEILQKMVDGSSVYKTANGITFAEREVKVDAGPTLVERVVSGEEICVYALGFYGNNLDALLKG